MANVLIRDVPDHVHQVLRDRAERQGQSLQHYLQAELARLSAERSVAEVFEYTLVTADAKVARSTGPTCQFQVL